MKRFFLVLLLAVFFACQTNQSRVTTTKNISKNGWIHTYNDEGSLSSSIFYKDNIRHGLAKDYYQNGNLRAEINYVNGLKEGNAKWFYKNGNLFRLTSYKNGERHGFQKKYYENGRMMSEVEFFEDHPGIGLKEYSKFGKERNSHPKIIVEKQKTNSDGSVVYEISLNNNVKEVDIFRGALINERFLHDQLIEINKTANRGILVLEKGQSKIALSAKYKTRYKNYRVIEALVSQ